MLNFSEHPLIRFIRTTIKGKLMFTGGLVLLGFISISVFFGLAMNALDRSQTLHTNIESLNSNLLVLRRNEKDFMARKDMKYVKKFNANKQKIATNMKNDISLMNEIGLQTGIIQSLQEEINNYTNAFTDFVNQQVIIGIDHKSGLHGALRNSVHLAEKQIKLIGDYRLLADMLMLRRNEKDFFQRKLTKYAEKFLKNYEILVHDLNNRSLSNKQKEAILQPLKIYKKDFLNIIKSYTLIGLTPQSGIHGKLRDSVHQAEDTLEYTITGISSIISEQEHTIKLILLSITSVFCVALLTFIGLIIRSILRPISALITGIQEITKSCNFSSRSEVHDQGEIGEINEQLNQFFNMLQGNIDQVNQQMHAISIGDFKQRITETFTGDLERLKQSTNASAESIMQTMHALDEVMHSLSEGDFKARMNENIEEAFRETVDNAMQSIDIALSETTQVMSHVSSGDFSQRITTDYKGDLLNLKNNINQSLQNLESAMSEITSIAISQKDGDLNQQVSGQYSGQLLTLKEAINTSAKNLSQVIFNLSDANQSISNMNQEISMGNNNLSKRTQQQGIELDGITRSLQTLTSATEHNVESARQATKLSSDAKSLAEKGGAVINETTIAMTEITESSKNIAEIITVINEIAFQTNLLALNASVEAARAGEQGRGFAVVATEVRNLAQRSASAAKEIEELISDSVTKVANGEGLINHSSDILSDIVSAVNNVSDVNAEISAASQEQLRSTGKVNTTISQLDAITQQNAALAEEISASSIASIKTVENMTHIIDFFDIQQAG